MLTVADVLIIFSRIPYLRTERILTKKTHKEEKSKMSTVFEERAEILPFPYSRKLFYFYFLFYITFTNTHKEVGGDTNAQTHAYIQKYLSN